MGKHILFTNYYWESDENGKDRYDYTREYLFEEGAKAYEWKTIDDVPDDMVNDTVDRNEEIEWDGFKYELDKFIKDSDHGFLLVGDVGTWRGSCAGGCYVNKFDDLYKFWENCRDIKVWDEGGHLYFKASHHDGNNYAELKELTCKGSNYASNHSSDSDQEVHETLWNSNIYTKLPHYAHKVWGCKKGA